MLVVEKPTRTKALTYGAINRELKKQANGRLSDDECDMITAGFVNSMDFSNAAQMHRSAESWAEIILHSLEQEKDS